MPIGRSKRLHFGVQEWNQYRDCVLSEYFVYATIRDNMHPCSLQLPFEIPQKNMTFHVGEIVVDVSCHHI